MSANLPFPLLTAPAQLASCQGWSEEVYRDLLAVQEGSLSPDAFERKHLRHKAILSLDLTGQTAQVPRQRPLNALLRIFDAQKVCIPALQQHGATAIRCADDDVVALFDEPAQAVEAAFEVHRRLGLAFRRRFQHRPDDHSLHTASCRNADLQSGPDLHLHAFCGL